MVLLSFDRFASLSQRQHCFSYAGAAKQLSVVHSRSMTMTDEVQCLAYSHHHEANQVLLAAGLLDCTIKVRGRLLVQQA